MWHVVNSQYQKSCVAVFVTNILDQEREKCLYGLSGQRQSLSPSAAEGSKSCILQGHQAAAITRLCCLPVEFHRHSQEPGKGVLQPRVAMPSQTQDISLGFPIIFDHRLLLSKSQLYISTNLSQDPLFKTVVHSPPTRSPIHSPLVSTFELY
jgi:hypothetical protein